MPTPDTESDIDWTACELIERVPGKVSGRPIVRGTRIMPDGIVNSCDMGESIEDIREDCPARPCKANAPAAIKLTERRFLYPYSREYRRVRGTVAPNPQCTWLALLPSCPERRSG